MNHTKEPWAINGGTNRAGDLFIWRAGEYFGGHAIAKVCEHCQEGAQANAARIVACVNGCASVANPEAVPELLKLLKEAVRRLGPLGGPWTDRANAAIALAEWEVK